MTAAPTDQPGEGPVSTTTGADGLTITPHEAPHLAETAYVRFADLAGSVRADQWGLPTDCEGWTVRDLIGHMVGAMRSAASLRELVRQQATVARRRRRHGGNVTDIMTALQVELTAGLTEQQLVAECRRLALPAARGRARTPRLLRRMRFPVQLGATTERWTVGYLVDVILTRDAWLHRVDLARALGVAPVLDTSHDARVVADVAAEWARRHGRPVHLELTGPAGGRFTFGERRSQAVPALTVDAVEFCRAVSGRAARSGLLEVDVPF
jgi:uncharacterized protein (TIGR03083 family)